MSHSTNGPGAARTTYADLPVVPGTDFRNSWSFFGEGDELGTLNWLTPTTRARAAGLVSTGELIDLSLPLDVPSPQMAPGRRDYRHRIKRDAGGRDDYVERFYLQGSTQWDGLQHVRFREFGYYGGRNEADLDEGALGVDRMAAHGLVGRAVLADVAGSAARLGLDLRQDARCKITADDIERVLDAQGTVLEQGDILLIRTGWLQWYRQLDSAGKESLRGSLHNGEGGLACPGLDPATATAQWLWDDRVAAIAADNPAVEALPVSRGKGFLHRLLIPLLGMPLGEYWDLDELAAACHRVSRHHFFLASVPMRVPAGAGSPANAVAVL